VSVVGSYRERGEDGVSEEELLRLVVGDAAAGRLWARFGSLEALAAVPLEAFLLEEGVGEARAARLHAAFALGRRAQAERARARRRIVDPRDAAALLVPRIGHLAHEEVHVLLMNRSLGLIRAERIARGGPSFAAVDTREVFRAAIVVGAAVVVLGHNHPSGEIEPSLDDVRLSRTLLRLGNTLGVEVRDHLVVAGARWTSMAARGDLAP
jgi:DNA repair protein RadC